jgi:hypothetical protein
MLLHRKQGETGRVGLNNSQVILHTRAMPPTQHETGLVDGDTAIHAVQKKITGNQALCGAGRISQPLAGRFDSDDEGACPACREQVAAAR